MQTQNNEALQFFAKLIEKELGIVYTEFNQFQLLNRLEEITKSLKFSNIDELFRSAQRGLSAEVRDLLLDTATNNETSFFRDGKLYQSLQNNLLPEMLKAKRTEPFTIWSAACSTGQEPYTLAMIMSELGDARGTRVDYRIVASDISSRVLARAKKANYTQFEVERGLAPALLNKYFEKTADQSWNVRASITNQVSFQKLNLLDSFSRLGQFDLIFCRNVLIYQDVQNKIRVINKLMSCMHPGAYLVLGAGESMIGLSENFETRNIGEAIIYRLKPDAKKMAG